VAKINFTQSTPRKNFGRESETIGVEPKPQTTLWLHNPEQKKDMNPNLCKSGAETKEMGRGVEEGNC